MGHGTCILPEQRLVLGRGHVSEIAASITATQVDHLKDMQINENEVRDLHEDREIGPTQFCQGSSHKYRKLKIYTQSQAKTI